MHPAIFLPDARFSIARGFVPPYNPGTAEINLEENFTSQNGTGIIRVLFAGSGDDLLVLEYCGSRERRTIPGGYGVREYGAIAAHALHDTLEQLCGFGLDYARKTKLLKPMQGWSKDDVKVMEVVVSGTIVRVFGFVADGQGEFRGRDAFVIVRVESVKAGRRGRSDYRKLRAPIMAAVVQAAQEYERGLPWLMK